MSKESFVVSCIRRLREYGEGMVLADQCISSIKDIVKSNAYTIIGMSQSGQKDRREMINVLGLNANQAEMVKFLDVGMGIVRLGGRYPFPQLLKFPLVKPKNLSNSKLDKINAKDQRVKDLLRGVKHVSGSEDSQSESSCIPQYTPTKKLECKTNKISDKSRDILLDIYNRFDVPSTARARDFDLSASASDRIFKYIEREQLVDVVRLNLTGGRGGTAKYHVLTNPKGYESISRKPFKKSGGTSAMHYFLQRYLKKHLPSKGFSDLEIEKNIGGKRIDVFGIYEGLKIAIELCVSTARTEHVNVQKNKGKCDFLIIATPDKKTREKLDRELYKNIEADPKLTTCVVHELLNNTEKIILKP